MKYVAFIDILGFKDKLKKMNQERAKQFIGNFSETAYITWRNLKPSHIKGYIVSDSFIIYSDDTSQTALKEFVKVIDAICKAEFSEHSILIRGAAAKGEFDKLEARELSTLKKQLIVGQAYVDAYLLEGEIKTTGIILNEDVYRDLLNIGEFEKNIITENSNKTTYYVLRYLTLDYLLDTKSMSRFVEQASNSGWLPHYYNSIYFSFRNETNEKKVNQIFLNILNIISDGSPNDNWREIDTFIRNAFNENVFPNLQTRFLRFIRKSIFK